MKRLHGPFTSPPYSEGVPRERGELTSPTMDTNRNNTGWIVSGVLAVVIAILLFMMWQQWDRGQKDLATVLDEGQENIMDSRARIAALCNGPQGTAAPACQDALDDLADILRDFRDDLDNATTTP